MRSLACDVVALASRDAEQSAPATPASRLTGSEPRRAGGLRRAFGPLRVVIGIALFALVVLAVVDTWDNVRETLRRISPYELVLAEALVLVGLGGSALTWRVAARELGSTVRVAAASKIYFLGQLAKYLPGSIWVLPIQMELGKRGGVPRARALAASVMAIGFNLVTGLAIGMLVVPSVMGAGAWRVVTLLALLLVGCVAISPPVLTYLLDRGFRAVRRPQLERDVSWSGVVRAGSFSIASWASYGASLWVLAVGVGAPAGESLPLCIAGFALAMTVGVLVVVAPSGIGIREAIIVAVLAPVLDGPEALAVALVARLLFTLADLVAAAAVVPVRLRSSEAV